MAQADSRSATGSRMTSLLNSEPRAIFQMIGNSRSAENPATYAGVTAASSITTPDTLVPVLTAIPATSSTDAAATLAIPPHHPKARAVRSSRPPVWPGFSGH